MSVISWKGTSQPIVPSLVSRIAEHSPELVLQIKSHLDQNKEPLLHRQTYDGTDASAKLCVSLVEALLALEQLRLELLDQTAAQIVPAHLMLAASEVMRVEPALLYLAKWAFQLHLYCWNATDFDTRRSETDG